jgi:hypothetical protein
VPRVGYNEGVQSIEVSFECLIDAAGLKRCTRSGVDRELALLARQLLQGVVPELAAETRDLDLDVDLHRTHPFKQLKAALRVSAPS